MRTASVSRSKGRTISVAGNSFMVSTKTSTAAVSSAPRASGNSTSRTAWPGVRPSTRAAAKKDGFSRASPDSTPDSATARKRTRYANTSAAMVPDSSSPVETPKRSRIQASNALSKIPKGTSAPTAITDPGSA